jgi:UDP-N-acetylglucosamine acyltransferase
VPIHPTALVDRRATIDPTAEIGPYVVIDGPVAIGARTRVMAHVVLLGRTVVGDDNTIHPGAVLGDSPQDLKYSDAPTGVRIGHRNVIREHVVVRGTAPETSTTIGDDRFLMSNAHVAHSCVIGDHVIVASGALLAGHVTVGDHAFVSGNCVVRSSRASGDWRSCAGSRASRDVPPFAILDGTHGAGRQSGGPAARRLRRRPGAHAGARVPDPLRCPDQPPDGHGAGGVRVPFPGRGRAPRIHPRGEARGRDGPAARRGSGGGRRR